MWSQAPGGYDEHNFWVPTLDLGFSGSSAGKESTCNAGDLGSIPGLGIYPGEGNGHSSIVAWRIPRTFPWGCKESDTLSNFHFVLITFASVLHPDSDSPLILPRTNHIHSLHQELELLFPFWVNSSVISSVHSKLEITSARGEVIHITRWVTTKFV